MTSLPISERDLAALHASIPGTRRLAPRVLAPMLDVTPKTLENWRKAGKGPPFITLSPRKVRYELQAVNAWLAGLAKTPATTCPTCGAGTSARRDRVSCEEAPYA